MNKFLKISAALSLLLSSVSIGTSSWIITQTSANNKTEIKKDDTTKIVCYNNKTNVQYLSVSAACELAKSGETIVVYPGTESTNIITESNNITVKNGVTLLLPYEGTNWNIAYSDKTSNITPDTNSSNVNSYRKIDLKMNNGADILVEQGGKLQIGGVTNSRGTSGLYSEITLGKGSSITVNGELTCYGYIKEEASTAISSKNTEDLTNSNDVERFIHASSTAIINLPLSIYNNQSGGTLTALADASVCPINEFYFSNLQTYAKFDHGAKVDATIRISAVQQYLEKTVSVIRPSGSKDKSIFYTENNSMVLEYIPINPSFTNEGPNKDYMKVGVLGNLTIGSLYVDASVITIDTSNYFLPFSYAFDIHIAENGVLTTPYKLKFLSGSKVNIHKGGSFNINNDVIFYKGDSLAGLNNEDGIFYPQNLNDAKLLNNGNITVAGNGKLGAFIEHTTKDNSATINLNNTTNANLTVTSVDGTTNNQIIIQSEVLTLNKNTNTIEKAPFSAGVTMTSNFNNTDYYWDGKIIETNTFKISIKQVNFAHPIYIYTVKTSTGPNGTGTVSNLAVDSIGEKEFNIEKGSYVNVNVSRANSSNFLSPSNEIYSKDKWYQVEGLYNLEITPSEGVEVLIKTQGNSGAGHVEYTIYESTSNDAKTGTWTPVAETKTGSVTGYVQKGLNFKFTTYSPNGIYYTTKQITRKPPECTATVHGLENSKSTKEKDLGNFVVYPATGDYTFDFKWNFEACIAKDTLVMMADGTTKPVQAINISDEVMVFNHETGKYESSKLLAFANHGYQNYTKISLKFDNGTTIDLLSEHELFDYAEKEYVIVNEFNAHSLIGHDFVTYNEENPDIIKTTKLIDVSTSKTFEQGFTIKSYKNLNSISNGLLTATPIIGLDNYFEYGNDLKYIESSMLEDINKYGLYSYDDWKDKIPYFMYEGYNFQYFKVSIGKGLMTYEDVLFYIELAENLIKSGEMIFNVPTEI